jgi:plasmid stabilization system protein ParE
MLDQYRIVYTPQAGSELTEISEFIERDSPQNAPEMISRIVEGIESLEILLHRYTFDRGTVRIRPDVRSMPVPPFLIRYRINEATRSVRILSIRHGARGSQH